MRQCLLHGLIALICLSAAGRPPDPGGEGLEIRIENFLVTPSTGPVTHLVMKNREAVPLSGRIEVSFSDGWRVEPSSCDFSLAGGETRPLAVTIRQARDRADNLYPVLVRWSQGGMRGESSQKVVCASAPFYKPKIDGDLADWSDAIPITLTAGGRKAVLRTFWNTKQFCVAVEVEEANLAPWRGKGELCDAIQFALAPGEAADSGIRHEFLAAQSAGWFGRPHCYRLFKPGDDIRLAAERRELKPLALPEAEVAVRRQGRVTRYEVALPWSLMPEIKAEAGREFRFSLLVHDPDGTGLRDFGEVMNRWGEDRRPNAWSSWNGVAWGKINPYDSFAKFGFCSSIH